MCHHIFLTRVWRMIILTVAQLFLVCVWGLPVFLFTLQYISPFCKPSLSTYTSECEITVGTHFVFCCVNPKWVQVVQRKNISSTFYIFRKANKNKKQEQSRNPPAMPRRAPLFENHCCTKLICCWDVANFTNTYSNKVQPKNVHY